MITVDFYGRGKEQIKIRNLCLMALPTVASILNSLKNRPASIQLKSISEQTGLDYGWLSMFHQGRISNPSYEKLKTLYEYLVKLDIKV